MKSIKRSLQRLLYSGGLTKQALKMRAGSPIILMYHGVTENSSNDLQNCEGKHVRSDLFLEQIRFLRKYRNVIRLTDMVEGIRRGDDLRNTVALTFDDGYENNHTVAAKILSDLNTTASFFLATGYIGVSRWMWTDRLEHALDKTKRNTITISDLPGITSLATSAEKKSALRRIKAYLKQQSGETCESYSHKLERDLGLSENEPYGDYRFMKWQQIKELSSAGFEVGAHTVNHPILSRIEREDAINEILASRERIRAEIDMCSEVFCYPNGKTRDYTSEIVDFCKAHFQAALSTNRGPARKTDLYELNRLGVSNDTTLPDLAWCLFREQ
jgi:peptidoglycan/xylan/chitin deacetylase (PgdA/CDA1 family)